MGGVGRPVRYDGRNTAGHIGTELDGHVPRCNSLPRWRLSDVEKNVICAGVRRQVAWMDGPRIVMILPMYMNASQFFSLEITTSSTGHLAGALAHY